MELSSSKSKSWSKRRVRGGSGVAELSTSVHRSNVVESWWNTMFKKVGVLFKKMNLDSITLGFFMLWLFKSKRNKVVALWNYYFVAIDTDKVTFIIVQICIVDCFEIVIAVLGPSKIVHKSYPYILNKFKMRIFLKVPILLNNTWPQFFSSMAFWRRWGWRKPVGQNGGLLVWKKLVC